MKELTFQKKKKKKKGQEKNVKFEEERTWKLTTKINQEEPE